MLIYRKSYSTKTKSFLLSIYNNFEYPFANDDNFSWPTSQNHDSKQVGQALAQRRNCRPNVGPTFAQPTLLSGRIHCHRYIPWCGTRGCTGQWYRTVSITGDNQLLHSCIKYKLRRIIAYFHNIRNFELAMNLKVNPNHRTGGRTFQLDGKVKRRRWFEWQTVVTHWI